LPVYKRKVIPFSNGNVSPDIRKADHNELDSLWGPKRRSRIACHDSTKKYEPQPKKNNTLPSPKGAPAASLFAAEFVNGKAWMVSAMRQRGPADLLKLLLGKDDFSSCVTEEL
jgi:hypothetical protein